MDNDDQIARRILELLHAREEAASICPSEVARSLEMDESAWRGLMPQIREVGRMLAMQGVILITQSKQALAPNADIRGPIRFRRGAKFRNGPRP
jgi:hypothetical protein